MKNYNFSRDYFGPVIQNFQINVSKLQGTPCKILEIGAFEGRSTTWMADNLLAHPDARLDTIDLHPQPPLRDNLAKCDCPEKINLHLGRSRDILRTLPLATYDFVYIDGSHATVDVLEDAVLSFRLIKINGILAFDDYLWDDSKYNAYGCPRPAIDAFMSIYADSPRYVPLVIRLSTVRNTQVWVQKIADDRSVVHS
jgi:predicted O-methyltransferase YrrM